MVHFTSMIPQHRTPFPLYWGISKWYFKQYYVIRLYNIEKNCRLRNYSDISVRFVTNTTKESKDSLINRLHAIGFTSICKEDIYSSLTAAVQYVKCHSLNPYYFLTEDAYKDFSDIPTGDEKNSVVVGLAPEKFTYDNMNIAFR